MVATTGTCTIIQGPCSILLKSLTATDLNIQPDSTIADSPKAKGQIDGLV